MSKIALVTGANQGLGFALVEGLARRLGPGDVVYLTGRDAARVAEARERVTGARAEVRTRLLDVRDGGAVNALARELHAGHGGVDVVLSNHYLRTVPGDTPAEVIGPYVDANNLGTTRMLRAFLPVLRPGGRYIVVSSALGRLRQLPPELHPRFDAAGTLEEIDATMLAWRDAVLSGEAAGEGWPEFVNIPSKVGQVAAVRVLARQRRTEDLANGRLLVATCPGMIDTASSRPWFDMTGAQTPQEAAVALLDLALDPDVDPALYGELVQFGKVLSWP
ncbi:SDR family NAD(P)-dependent oxidoreductase [Planobispora siamensis]|uniref:Carbonyl reductase n=1 Tax=Planobispora siamensis TaxID=936338 RepID=A0A8J3WPR0_9ACTN|nr:SDR family NAD(P)-dependent oxidoreductase [Planobispora siamensis]GIH97190.1 carbonyl reductase [Planobispora siamensis]